MKKVLILLLISLLAVSVVSAQTTYKDGDAYIGEDPYDPDWVWDVSAFQGMLPKLGIESDFVWNDDSDNPVGIGQCMNLPDSYVQICLDYLISDAFFIYTIEFDGDTDLSEVDPKLTSVPAFYLHTDDSNGFKIFSGGPTANKLWLYIDGSDVNLYYEDSNGKTQNAGAVNLNYDFAVVNTDAIHIVHLILSESKGYYTLTLKSDITDSISEKIILKLGIESSNILTPATVLEKNFTISNRFGSLGLTKSLAEADELIWEKGDTTGTLILSNIGTKDEDHRSMYGTVIKNPKSHGASDEVVLHIPDKQVKAQVMIGRKGSGGIVAEVPLGTSIVGPFSYYLDYKDLPGMLSDTSIKFDGKEIDIHEAVELLNGGPSIETSLTSGEDDYKTAIFLESQSPDRVKYYYYFDEYIDLSRVSAAKPLNINFLGKDLSITGVTAGYQLSVGAAECANEGELCGGIAGIVCCSDLTCQLEGTYPDASGKCAKGTVKCTDSDGGKDYYTKGTTTGVDSQGKSVTEEDNCGFTVSNTSTDVYISYYVNEFYCIGSVVYGTQYECPNGCEDGACIQQSTNCTDSDGGDNFYEKGFRVHYNPEYWGYGQEQWDYCILDPVISGNSVIADSTKKVNNCSSIDNCYIIEYHCTNDLSDAHTGFKCSNGCQDGACIIADHCNNGVQDGDEEDVDCGGSCNDCIVEICDKNGICEIKQDENSNNCPEDCYCGDDLCDSSESYKECPEDCRYCTPEWECHLEPATCPEEGIQNKVCVDTKCGTEEKRIEALKCIPGTCSGCLSNGICYPVTTRMLLYDTPSYCDVTKRFAKQKDLEVPCQNNYECLSNECSDGECISIKKELEETQSLLQRILDWLKSIF